MQTGNLWWTRWVPRGPNTQPHTPIHQASDRPLSYLSRPSLTYDPEYQVAKLARELRWDGVLGWPVKTRCPYGQRDGWVDTCHQAPETQMADGENRGL